VRARPVVTRRRGSSSRGGGRASGARAPQLEACSSVGLLLRPVGAPPTAPSGTGMAEPRRVGEQVDLLEDEGRQRRHGQHGM
jgi:hypothetical protein